MRENIGKFRGKRVDNGEWVYGFYVKFAGSCLIYEQDDENRDYLGNFIVDPETVGEFTGLQDSNGKEIYEGDICKVRLNSEKPDAIGVIVFTRGCYYWNEYFLYEVIHELEVINNIHDNPELLEK